MDPDYKYILGLFEGCLERHGFGTEANDFVWNKNRLQMEKLALKESIQRVTAVPAEPKE